MPCLWPSTHLAEMNVNNFSRACEAFLSGDTPPKLREERGQPAKECNLQGTGAEVWSFDYEVSVMKYSQPLTKIPYIAA